MGFHHAAALLGGFLVASAALAQDVPPATPSDRLTGVFEQRQARQSDRIARGIEAGRIGAREEALLGRQQASLDRAFDRRVQDGRLGVRDARALDRRFDRGSAGIRVARVRGPRG